jgi:hypothetical protein
MSAHPRNIIRATNEAKIFDPRDPATGSGGAELSDATVVLRDDQWWMYLAGQAAGYGPTQLYSASLPAGAPLSASGWTLMRDPAGALIPLAGQRLSASWDAKGGRHCPSYIKGFDPHTGVWVERIYYAGAAENLWGPYTIGYLEWSGAEWIDQPVPVFSTTEDWEHGSVYEPNLIYAEGKWKMWYVAGSNMENYLIHGFTESDDGRTNWSEPAIFAPEEMKLFDFCVRRRKGSYEAVFSRVWLAGTPPPSETGLWWCHSTTPSSNLSDWSEPIQIMNAEDKGWHTGPWKPSFVHDSSHPSRAFVFFDGAYRTSDPGPFPFAFTTGCIELDLP